MSTLENDPKKVPIKDKIDFSLVILVNSGENGKFGVIVDNESLKQFVPIPLFLSEMASVNIYHESLNKNFCKFSIDMARVIQKVIGSMKEFDPKAHNALEEESLTSPTLKQSPYHPILYKSSYESIDNDKATTTYEMERLECYVEFTEIISSPDKDEDDLIWASHSVAFLLDCLCALVMFMVIFHPQTSGFLLLMKSGS